MAPKAPMLDAKGKKAKDVTLAEGVFAAELKSHLVHETVRAEQAAARAGSHVVKSRGLVSGGRSKPWRQKGTGRARAGTTRAPQWAGGGVAFAPARSFELKVNRKTRKAAFRGALSAHAQRGSLAVVDGSVFGEEPSTKQAAALLEAWGAEGPIVVLARADERALVRSFRNLERVLVLEPSELEVGALVWARSVLASQSALDRVQEVMA
jgi:large subunit ribosomal protein L4